MPEFCVCAIWMVQCSRSIPSSYEIALADVVFRTLCTKTFEFSLNLHCIVKFINFWTIKCPFQGGNLSSDDEERGGGRLMPHFFKLPFSYHV